MHQVNFTKVLVSVSYKASPESLVEKMGVNGSVGKVVRRNPDWNILSPESSEWENTTEQQKEVVLFVNEENRSPMQVLRDMGMRHLRPVVLHEFSNLESGAELTICLGTMWGGVGRECMFSWENNRGILMPVGPYLKPGTCLPAIHHCGNTNPLPGMPKH